MVAKRKRRGNGRVREVGHGKPTRPHCRAQGPLLRAHAAAWREGGAWGRRDLCVRLSPFSGSPETMATLVVSSPPTESKKAKKKDCCQSRLCVWPLPPLLHLPETPSVPAIISGGVSIWTHEFTSLESCAFSGSHTWM